MRKKTQSTTDDLEQRMREIAREVCQEILQSTPHAPVMPRPEIVAASGRGRKENRKYERITAAIDTVVYDCFKAEREQLNLSTGKLLDLILWERYGKPKLSFEKE